MEKLISISGSLEFLFKSIESLLGVEFKSEIMEKIIEDSQNDLVGKKNYILNIPKNRITIIGLVEE